MCPDVQKPVSMNPQLNVIKQCFNLTKLKKKKKRYLALMEVAVKAFVIFFQYIKVKAIEYL